MKALARIFVLLGVILVLAIILFAIVHRDRRPRVFFAAEQGDTNFISQYLSSGSNVDALILIYRYGGHRCAPLLDVAIANARIEAVDFLLKKGANPNQRDAQGKTPLMW